MKTLLIKNIKYLVTCDEEDHVYEQASIYSVDGVIKEIYTKEVPTDIIVDEVLDGSHMAAYPGLINTHHHLYQILDWNSI